MASACIELIWTYLLTHKERRGKSYLGIDADKKIILKIKYSKTDNEYLKCTNNKYKISVSMFWIQEATLLVCAPPLEIVLILQ